MDDNGVLSIDLLLATFILIIAVGAMTTFISQSLDSTDNMELSNAKALGDTIARSINSVYSNGNGSYIILDLPGDFEYETKVVSGSVDILYDGKVSSSLLIPESNKVNTVTMYPNESWEIRNINSQITFTKKSS